MTGTGERTAVVCALAAMMVVLGWQALTVHANYGGNWTGLFRTGGTMAVPDNLQASTFRNRHPIGYDGQYYRFLAHDPLLRRGTAAYMDDALLRSRRILLPLTAWTLAGGQQGAIDYAYVLAVAGFIGLGTYWLALIMMREGRHAALGLLFVALPVTLVCVDSMTVDVALAALTAGFVWQILSGGRERGTWLIVAAAALVRETGLALVAAWVLEALTRRKFRQAMLRATALLPVLAWYGYLHAILPKIVEVQPWVLRLHWDLGIMTRTLHPQSYPLLGAPVERIIQVLDSLGLAAMMAIVVIGALRIRKAPRVLGIAFGLYVALMLAMTNPKFYDDPYTYSRCYAPIFVLVLAGTARLKWQAMAIVVALCLVVDVRMLAEMKTELVGVAHWLGLG